MKIYRLCLLLLFAAGCTPPVYEQTTYGLDDFIADSASQGNCTQLEPFQEIKEEQIIEGDELSIALYNPSRKDHVQSLKSLNQSIGFQVREGKVVFPHLGEIEVEGLTLPEIRDKAQCLYREQFSDGQIFINFKKKKERFVQIIGGRKGKVSVDGSTRLNEVLAKAGVSPSANLFKSHVVRNGEILPIDFYRLIHEGDPSQNIVMREGDQIFLAACSDASILVTGEIPKSIVVPVPYGTIPLREALAIAGGIPFTGDKCCIGIIRGGVERPKVYCLNWRELGNVSNQSLLLMPGDVVVISETHLVQWNRFIDQLQPSTCTMQTVYDIYEVSR